MDRQTVAQAPAVAEPSEGDLMANVEMFPSSAVAQTNFPGSVDIGALQQPPLHHNLSPRPNHQRVSSSLYKPAASSNDISVYNNAHSFGADGGQVSVSVNPVTDLSQDNSIIGAHSNQQGMETMAGTNTATTSAMMVDEAVPPPDAKDVAPPAKPDVNDDKVAKTETKGSDVSGSDANSSSSVRKVR